MSTPAAPDVPKMRLDSVGSLVSFLDHYESNKTGALLPLSEAQARSVVKFLMPVCRAAL